eukprot:536024_1
MALLFCILGIIYHLFQSSFGSAKYFISEHGTDASLCGNQLNPCATLYFASILINEGVNNHNEIYIVDGQNITQILFYQQLNNTHNWDPCIPTRFYGNKSLAITFNIEYINHLRDWYPLEICSQPLVHTNYKNQYLFDGGNTIIINNLIIDDYSIDGKRSYPFIQSAEYINASVTCNNCSFINISSSNTNPLLVTNASIYIINNLFLNVVTVGEIISDRPMRDIGWVYSRHLKIQDSIFRNIASKCIISTWPSNNDILLGCNLMINSSNFDNISVADAIIFEEAYACDITISDIQIDIQFGTVLLSYHQYPSNIYINNLSILSNQLNPGNNDALLYFALNDITNIAHLKLSHEYNATSSCSYFDTIWNSIINASCDRYLCINPLAAIESSGQINMSFVHIDVDISYGEKFSSNPGYFTRFAFDGNVPYIWNKGIMHITNIILANTICYIFLKNEYSLSVSELSFVSSFERNYNPNLLHSHIIIWQSGRPSSLYVSASNFIGSQTHLHILGGTADIRNSNFQNSNQVFITWTENIGFVMDNCEIRNSGVWNAAFESDEYIENFYSQSQIGYSSNVIIRNSKFSGFNVMGFLLCRYSTNVSLINNTFNIDTSDLYYNISTDNLAFLGLYGPLHVFACETRIIGNYFGENIVNHQRYWIRYTRCEQSNCISANTFTNYAIYLNDTDLTSCFRPELVECITNPNKTQDCQNGMYGNIDSLLVNKDGYFIMNNTYNIEYIIYGNDSNIALDNINITMINGETNPITITASNGDILLIDSYVTNKDISYYVSFCVLTENSRLSSDPQYIAKIRLNCSKNNNETYLNQTMKSNITAFTNYLSSIIITLIPYELTYFPGQLLQFDYQTMDKLGNHIPNNMTHDTVLNIDSDTFSTEIDIINGECLPCDTGILINTISIQRDIHGTIDIFISVADELFYVQNDALSFDIIGCPIMYGPEDNNYTCTQCNTDYYSIQNGNVGKCVWCNPKKNSNIKCGDVKIIVERDYWLGFEGQNMISSMCALGYCCQVNDGCDYLQDKSSLCAGNRDYKSMLCSKCKDQYSESMNATSCAKCKAKFYWKYILFSMFTALFWTLYILITASDEYKINPAIIVIHKPQKKKFMSCNCSAVRNGRCCKSIAKLLANKRLMLFFKTILNRNIIYYMQALSQILSGGSYMILFSIFIQMFNFSFITNTSNTNNVDESWCFVNGLEARGKILLDLLIPCIIAVYFCIISIISNVFYDGRIAIKCIKREVNFAKTVIAMILLLIGSVLAVLFKLMSCTKVGNHLVHVHFGYENCYGSTWNVSLIILIMIIFIFSVVFINLRRYNSEERQSSNSILKSFVVKYKPHYYYWEHLIFIRRICIAFYSVSIEDDSFTLIFITILVIFLSIHIQCQPFIIELCNNLESILLGCLIVIVTSQALSSMDKELKKYITSFLIFLPFTLMVYFIYKFMKMEKEKQFVNYNELDDFMDDNELNLSTQLNDLSNAPISYHSTNASDIPLWNEK